VPRVWEKIYDKMMEVARSNSGIVAKIGKTGYIQELGQRVSARRVQFVRKEVNRQVGSLS
jgi:long-subunit acyl-CoA synthetase (AMP-forming)